MDRPTTVDGGFLLLPKGYAIRNIHEGQFVHGNGGAKLLQRPASRSLVVAAHQQITREWWRRRLQDFDVCISQFVLDEAGRGHVLEARKRLALLASFKLLDANAEALALAKSLVAAGYIPAKAGVDAAHIAVASVHHMHFLLTWNCKHIAMPSLRIASRSIAIKKAMRVRSFASRKNCLEVNYEKRPDRRGNPPPP